jgi:peptide-methionine (S)-S-oxide reductase
METAYFAAGCFWGIQQQFHALTGVTDTVVGYMGGHTTAPDYRSVCSGTTGHAETVKIVFDPEVISFDALLSHFFAWHDPTQVNRQGPDIGTQYRSAIFPQTDEQRETAQRAIQTLEAQGRFSAPIATTIEVAHQFWDAEDYHQHYFENRGRGQFSR